MYEEMSVTEIRREGHDFSNAISVRGRISLEPISPTDNYYKGTLTDGEHNITFYGRINPTKPSTAEIVAASGLDTTILLEGLYIASDPLRIAQLKVREFPSY